jgi:glycosyltransferase involved in cell wall biosynthesis
MKYPRISIITPSFNQYEFLENTIRSVLDQNYPNLEYVIIDGGSTDGSVDIIKKYAGRLTYWISEKDKGLYDAINKGFSHTSGEIMGWINSSDMQFPWTLQTIAEIFTDNKEVKWIHGLPSYLSQSGNNPRAVDTFFPKNMYDALSGHYTGFQQESIFWKRELWDKSGGALNIKYKSAEDIGLWLRFFKYEKLYYVNLPLGCFRYHDFRIGGDDHNVRDMEVKEIFKNFRSGFSFSKKAKAYLVKILVGRKRILSKFYKKTKILPWYGNYLVNYDFSAKRWHISGK